MPSRDDSNLRARVKLAGFPVRKTLDDFKVQASSVPQATFDYLAGLEWIRAKDVLSPRRVPDIGPNSCGAVYVCATLLTSSSLQRLLTPQGRVLTFATLVGGQSRATAARQV